VNNELESRWKEAVVAKVQCLKFFLELLHKKIPKKPQRKMSPKARNHLKILKILNLLQRYFCAPNCETSCNNNIGERKYNTRLLLTVV